ncbi:alpha/beta fold hydrolase [Ktedonospora formicarum]|uniref:Alpha/beta hydrolase n=1 Tax=Ktedonospora formicarum TaxID=2778364 RepID=A0A8J3HWS9_9CHLR|nr:alpha/beta hydrolase [Ktedonospora formicarum]GHO42112.1 alpha/beta hydrolase [Ktedonospora formicarum]
MDTHPSSFKGRTELFTNDLTVHIDEQGSGRPILILHGGGGPQTVVSLITPLSERAYVLTPTHPGFAGQPRPEWFDSIDDLARTYLELLQQLDLHDVLIIGSSMGGWIASEMAVRDTARLSGIVLIDAVGIQVEGHPVVDVFSLTPNELSALSFHNPSVFRANATTISSEQAAATAANFQALKAYDQGLGMSDPKLMGRLGRVSIPVLVIWGESDRVADLDYGRAYAQSFPNARFQLIREAGHLPQIEQPERLLIDVSAFADDIIVTPKSL